MSGEWGDCSEGCPVSGGGSKQGLCTDRCGVSTALANHAGYACYCDTECAGHGDCCTGYSHMCGEDNDGVPHNDLLLGLPCVETIPYNNIPVKVLLMDCLKTTQV